MSADITGSLPLIGVSLEAQALQKFGAAVQNQLGGGLAGKFAGGVIGNVANAILFGTANAGPSTWQPTPYAAAIAGGAGGFDPKTKFLFKVTFRFIPDVADQACDLLGIANDGSLASQLTFTIKQIDMPKYTFEYEDINMYNFRTKYLKMIKHEELGFQMYDSTGNQALRFINAYLQLLVPASRQTYPTNYSLENNGFAFTSSPNDGLDTSMRGSLGTNGTQTNVLDSMIIDQYYLSRDAASQYQGPNVVNAIKVNSFQFTNPRVTRFEISDQDHEKGGEPSMIMCGFDFDSLNILTDQQGTDRAAQSPFLSTGDLLANPTGAVGSVVGPGNNGNPLVNLVAGAVGRQATQTLNSLLSQHGIGNSPGGGLLAGNVSAALGTNAARTLATVGGNTGPGIAPPTFPAIGDNSASVAQTQNLSSQSSLTGFAFQGE